MRSHDLDRSIASVMDQARKRFLDMREKLAELQRAPEASESDIRALRSAVVGLKDIIDVHDGRKTVGN